MDLATFLVQCLNSLQYGLLLFLVASGLTLIFGIMGVINLAHGSFYMIGAYMAYALAPFVAATLGGGFFATLALGLVLAVLLGYVLEWAFFSFLYGREHLQQVLMTYGLILVFEELRSILVGDDVHGVPPPPWLAGSHAAGRADDLPGLPAVHLGGVPGRGAGDVVRAGAHAAGHEDPRRRHQPRDGAVAGRRHHSCCTASSSPPAWRWRCWPAWWRRRCPRSTRAWATRC